MTRFPLFPHFWAALLAPLVLASGCVTSSEDLDALEEEASIQDADADGVAASQDCDDTDPSVGSQANDGDCDGIVSGLDCDDSDPALGSEASDGDCDGVVASWDCDDQDPAQASRENDADCDGVATEEDCDDDDARFFAPPDAGDCDGDGYLDDTEDCDPRDAESTHIGNDADCDGAITEEDCNDADPELVSVAYDRDCDGYVLSEDCDDDNAAVNPAAAEVPWDGLDNDCDGERSHPAVEVVVGGSHACAVTTEAELVCWGNDSDGQASPPAEALPIGLSAGPAATCSIDSGGVPLCWGDYYPLSAVDDPSSLNWDGTGVARVVFTKVGRWMCTLTGGGTFACIEDMLVGGAHYYYTDVREAAMSFGQMYVIETDGNLNYGGRYGSEWHCAYERNRMYRPGGEEDHPWTGFEALSAGEHHMAFILDDGSMRWWGCDSLRNPIEVPTSAASEFWVQVASGRNHFCGRTSDGGVDCWGENTDGQTDVPEGTYTFVAAGGNSSCAIRADSEVVCWGNDSVGQSSPP